MRIVSELTGKEYKTVAECEQAEAEFILAQEEKKKKDKELADARKSRAKEVENAYLKISEAQKNYNELLKAFVKDYGSFHMTVKTGDSNPFNLFDRLFEIF